MNCYTNEINSIAPLVEELAKIRDGRRKCAKCVDCAADFIARIVLLNAIVYGRESTVVDAREIHGFIRWHIDDKFIGCTGIPDTSYVKLREETMSKVMKLINSGTVNFKCSAQETEYRLFIVASTSSL